jgi:hypothetical protein
MLKNRIFKQLRVLVSPLVFLQALVELINLNLKATRDVLFIVSPVDVQTPLGNHYFPDKLEGVIKVVEDHKLSVLYAFHLFSIKNKFERKSDFKRLEILIPLIIISHPIMIIKNFGVIKEVFLNQRFITLKQKIRASLWISLFLLVKPKIIFGIGMDQVILSVCKRMQIETVEVMHGLFDSVRSLFSFTIEPEIVKPGLFLGWHDDFTKMVGKLGISAVTIGYPNTLLQRIDPPLVGLPERKILVTLGSGYKVSVDLNGIMSPELYKYLEEIPSNNLKFRLHPVSCNSKKQILQNSKWLKKEFPDCSLVLPYDESLLESLSSCSFHVSHESSTFFEASLLGITTLLLTPRDSFLVPIPEEITKLNLLYFDKNLFKRKFKNMNQLHLSPRFTAPFQKIALEKILNQLNLIN